MQPLNFDEVLQRILSQDTRYPRDAYLFLREALDFTQRQLTEGKRNEPRHVSGRELLGGLRAYALAQFGPMAKTVLNEWGITKCQDFGEIVFNMVDQGLLSKTENDSRQDFKDGFDFEDAFCAPFRPQRRAPIAAAPQTKPEPT
ncbi:MAG: Minf_1886 family protein [Verrucomicrobiota bacterium]